MSQPSTRPRLSPKRSSSDGGEPESHKHKEELVSHTSHTTAINNTDRDSGQYRERNPTIYQKGDGHQGFNFQFRKKNLF